MVYNNFVDKQKNEEEFIFRNFIATRSMLLIKLIVIGFFYTLYISDHQFDQQMDRKHNSK